eukprot:15124384-Alexandrium_andersonii.AAC.1
MFAARFRGARGRAELAPASLARPLSSFGCKRGVADTFGQQGRRARVVRARGGAQSARARARVAFICCRLSRSRVGNQLRGGPFGRE